MTEQEHDAKVLPEIDGHFCHDWDGLAVSAWTPEYDCCVCYPKTLLGRLINKFVMWRFYRIEKQCSRRNTVKMNISDSKVTGRYDVRL